MDVSLRPPVPGDIDELLALHRASQRFYRGLATPPLTRDGVVRYLQACEREDFVGLLICRGDAVAGTINISQIARGALNGAYLGYYVGASHAGQGVMTRALPLALDHAFMRLKLHRLEANIQPHNEASIRLVRAAGFTREGFSRRYLKIAGRWRDHERWAILAEDWKELRRSRGRARGSG